ncbi:unnamed protein product [Brassica oleracea]
MFNQSESLYKEANYLKYYAQSNIFQSNIISRCFSVWLFLFVRIYSNARSNNFFLVILSIIISRKINTYL